MSESVVTCDVFLFLPEKEVNELMEELFETV